MISRNHLAACQVGYGAGELQDAVIGADRFGVLNVALVGQVFVVDTGDFHVNIDTVDEWAADLLPVAGDGYGGITALFDGVAVEAARTGVRVAVAE